MWIILASSVTTDKIRKLKKYMRIWSQSHPSPVKYLDLLYTNRNYNDWLE